MYIGWFLFNDHDYFKGMHCFPKFKGDTKLITPKFPCSPTQQSSQINKKITNWSQLHPHFHKITKEWHNASGSSGEPDQSLLGYLRVKSRLLWDGQFPFRRKACWELHWGLFPTSHTSAPRLKWQEGSEGHWWWDVLDHHCPKSLPQGNAHPSQGSLLTLLRPRSDAAERGEGGAVAALGKWLRLSLHSRTRKNQKEKILKRKGFSRDWGA